jgi:hypothetical protein
MKKNYILMLSGIIGLISFFLLNGWLRILAYFIPAITICRIFSKDGFNVRLFVILSLIFLLLPSNMLALDIQLDMGNLPFQTQFDELGIDENLIIREDVYEQLDNYEIVIDEPYNENEILVFFNNIYNIISTIFFFIIPTALLVGSIYAFVIGNVEQGVSGLTKFAMVLVYLLIAVWLLNLAGIELPEGIENMIEFVENAMNEMIDFFAEIGADIDDIAEAYSGTQSIKMDEVEYTTENIEELVDCRETDIIPIQQICILLELEKLNSLDSSMSIRYMLLSVTSVFPAIISMSAFFLGIYMSFTKEETLEKMFAYTDEDLEQRINIPFKFNINFVYLLIFFLTSVLMLYLFYDIETLTIYSNFGFFTIYSLIIAVVLIFLTFGIGSYTKNSRETIFGIIYGIVGLFLFFNMFTYSAMLDISSNEYDSVSILSIINNFLFVAPTESLLFHVFIPSIYIFGIYYRKNQTTNEKIDEKITELQIENSYLENYETANLNLKKTDNYKSIIKQKGKNIRKMQKLKKQKNEDIENIEKFMSKNQYYGFIAVVIFSNVIFAILHIFNADLTFLEFLSSGLFFIYFGSGIWISYISFRYGYIAGILTHALNNSLKLLLLLVFL